MNLEHRDLNPLDQARLLCIDIPVLICAPLILLWYRSQGGEYSVEDFEDWNRICAECGADEEVEILQINDRTVKKECEICGEESTETRYLSRLLEEHIL